MRDHPRACGEHSCLAFRPAPCPGSSPRMRGTRMHYGVRPVAAGIIPAHAGNTMAIGVGTAAPGDHPRACGEHYPLSSQAIGRMGSSPRMRGTLYDVIRQGEYLWIIPAHAGNTSPRMTGGWSVRDHPRACGEHAVSLVALFTQSGSSPRMRGTR